MKLEYYVINEINHGGHRGAIEKFNIFQNVRVKQATEKLLKTYYSENLSFEAFCKELDSILKWQEWSRCEYEIIVKSLFDKNGETQTKLDTYTQASWNIEAIALWIIHCNPEKK